MRRNATQPTTTNLRARRSGISLLEVLISVFVMTVGLLGLAALIPIGRFEIQEAAKLDRGSTLGKEAHRQLLIRGLLDSQKWVIYDGNAKEYVWFPTYLAGLSPADRNAVLSAPFVIDPMLLAHRQNRDVVFGNNNAPSPATFPYHPNNYDAIAGLTNPPVLRRFSLVDMMPLAFFTNNRINPTSLGANDPQSEKDTAMSEYLFRGRDDLAFAAADDGEARPVRQFNIRDGGDFQNQPALDRLSGVSEGAYSWLVTISPSMTEAFDPVMGQYSLDHMRTFVVSVVVFHNRPFPIFTSAPDDNDPPAERTVGITFGGSGIGGGSVHLSCDPANKNYLRDLKPNQWLYVTGRLNVPINPAPVIGKWYRIVSVDDGSGLNESPAHRDVTLDGPDWDVNRFQSLGDAGEGPMTSAAIFDGVVAVYDKTMQLNLTGN